MNIGIQKTSGDASFLYVSLHNSEYPSTMNRVPGFEKEYAGNAVLQNPGCSLKASTFHRVGRGLVETLLPS